MFHEPGLEGKLRKPDHLDIVLCTTRAARQYTENFLDYLGIRGITVLGRDLDHWRHIYKIELIVKHIQNNPDPGLLLHLDAPDVLITGELQAAVDYFLALRDCNVLFGAEKNSAPGAKSTRNLPPSDRQFISRIEQFEKKTYAAPFHHLNAGCFIGHKQAMLDLFSRALQYRKGWKLEGRLHHGDYLYNDDQLVMREIHRQCYPEIQVDHACGVFQNLYATRRKEIASANPLPGGGQFLAAYLGYLKDILAGKIRRRISKIDSVYPDNQRF